MLKTLRVLFLGFIVLAGSACVTPTHASSAQAVIITYVQAAGPTGAKEELVVLYNSSATPVDMINWCLTNKTAAFVCLLARDDEGLPYHYVLPGYSYATIASTEYLTAHSLTDTAVSMRYDVTSQSSGSIVNSADTISLVDAEGEVVSTRSWTTAPSSGKAWARLKLMSGPDVYAVNNNAADWNSIVWEAAPPSNNVERFIEPPVEVPEEPEPEPEPGIGEPIDTISPIIVSEIFPNAAGADTGKEFIELYNPDLRYAQSLDGLRLRIGLESAKWYTLPLGVTLAPGGYISFTDAQLGFTLVNTNGGVQLYRGEIALGERIEYSAPKDDDAWALIDGEWQYTTPTPGSINLARQSDVEAEREDGDEPKPCATNQFRNPETGRCKLIASAASTPTACKEGQERNPETNRCRTIAVASSPTPCKEGQERNPETNRCRNVVKMSSAGYDVKGVQAKASAQLSWYYWAAIIAVVALIVGYAVWEWRQELANIWKKIRGAFAKK